MLLEVGIEQITSTAFSSPYPFWLQSLLYVGIVGPIGWVLYYLKEKGKNAATKEDVGSITKEIESVKSQFTQQTERLKSQLTLLVNVKSDIYSLERDAIVEANEKLFLWISYLMETVSFDDYEEITRYLNKIESAHKEQQKSEAKFQLFIEDKALHEELNKVSMKIFLHFVSKRIALYEAKKILEDQEYRHEEEQERFTNQLISKTNEQSKSDLLYYSQIAPLLNTFRSKCREYIYSKTREA